MAPVEDDVNMEQRALAAEARASDLLAEVKRLQALLEQDTNMTHRDGAVFRRAPMLVPPQTGPRDALVPPATKPSAESQSTSSGWGVGLGGWGLDAVKHVAAVALETTTGAAPGVAATASTSAGSDAANLLAHRWSRFASLCIDGTWRQCICLADAKGCQVWDVDDPASIRSLAQLHLRGVSCIAPLHAEGLRADESSALSDPSILAVGATDDEGSSTLVFYSLGRGEFVTVDPVELASIQAAVDRLFAGHADDGEPHRGSATEPPAVAGAGLDEVPLPGSALQLRLPRAICDLVTAAPHLVIAIEGAVLLLDSCTAMPARGQKLRVVATLPPPPTEPQRAAVAVAAAAEWLAYAEPAESGSVSTDAGSESQGAMQEELSLSSALTAATGIGSRLLDAVTQPGVDEGHDVQRPASAGVVVLERLRSSDLDQADLPARLRFTAHRSSPISALQFDKTGRLLVTASQGGKTLKVFRIPGQSVAVDTAPSVATESGSVPHVDTATGPGMEPKASSPVLLYTLTRGTFMDADICSISFSDDSRFVAVATSHGTAHVFAISPSGGAVDAVTHGIGNSMNTSSRRVVAHHDQQIQNEAAALQRGHSASVLSTEVSKTVPNLIAVARVKRRWIPSHVVTQGFPESQTATHYTIRCSTHSGAAWDVSKRYSELAALKYQLENQEHTSEAIERIAQNAEFPAKTWGLGSWGKLDESTIKARKEKLQLWLGNVLQHCVNEPAVIEFLRPDTLRDRAAALRGGHGTPEDGGRQGDLPMEWPIHVEFVKTENKSDGTLLPMAVNFLKPGGGRLIDINGEERVARESFLVFSAGQLSLHHILMDIAVSISEGGEMQLGSAH